MADEGQPTANAQAAPPAASTELYRSYNFMLDVEGVAHGNFMRMSGLGFKIPPIKVRSGGMNQIVHMLPGPVEYSEVTLSYGLVKADSEELWTWLMSAVTGRVTTKHVSIIMLAPAGDVEVVRWNLNYAWPTSWQGAELDALGREVAVESITLVYESITRA